MSSDGSHRSPRLLVSVVDEYGRPLRAPALAAWIAVASDRRVRALNRQYRGIDRATDVLSFPAVSDSRIQRRWSASRTDHRSVRRAKPPVTPGAAQPHRDRRVRTAPARFLGDIVIARGVAARQAREAGHPARIEWRVLALHGLLHLLGYDHERDAGEMGRLERRLRRRGGLGAGLIEREDVR
jgi:probable rRNA maturation factor